MFHNWIMNNRIKTLVAAALAICNLTLNGAEARPAPIQTVEIRDRSFYVNGKAFFPLMGWLQDATNFPRLKACGMNTKWSSPPEVKSC